MNLLSFPLREAGKVFDKALLLFLNSQPHFFPIPQSFKAGRSHLDQLIFIFSLKQQVQKKVLCLTNHEISSENNLAYIGSQQSCSENEYYNNFNSMPETRSCNLLLKKAQIKNLMTAQRQLETDLKPLSKPKKLKFPKPPQVWNMTQEKRYLRFLQHRQDLFSLPLHEKRKIRINIQMSKYVQSKNSQQCHSHHQKMFKKYGSIETIIQKIQQLLKRPISRLPASPDIPLSPSFELEHDLSPQNIEDVLKLKEVCQNVLKQEFQASQPYIYFIQESIHSVKLEDSSR